MGIPLCNKRKPQKIWSSQSASVSCVPWEGETVFTSCNCPGFRGNALSPQSWGTFVQLLALSPPQTPHRTHLPALLLLWPSYLLHFRVDLVSFNVLQISWFKCNCHVSPEYWIMLIGTYSCFFLVLYSGCKLGIQIFLLTCFIYQWSHSSHCNFYTVSYDSILTSFKASQFQLEFTS